MSSSPLTGWTGRILHVDLTTRSTTVEKPPAETYERWIGGRGLAGLYLEPHITLPWDDPGMPLLLFTGPLVGTPAPTSGRMCIMSRSPLTGTIGDCSVGGRLATQLKRAGWDGVVITGRSGTVCGLEITDQDVAIVPAEGLQGLDTQQVVDTLADRGSIATIGPAAHNRVRFSSIVVDRRHFAGRNGLGLVMASKNLQYLKVFGTGRTPVADADTLERAQREIQRLIGASPILGGELGLSSYGTGAIYDLMHARHMMPTANFRSTYFPPARSMNAWAYREKYGSRKGGCSGCTVLCKRSTGEGRELPEFETMSHFSALLENEDLDTVVAANEICSRFGMDTISAAATIACYAEIEDRTLSPADIVDTLNDIGSSRGIGELLKLGSFEYAERAGFPETAVTVKAQELPAYDPRGSYGMALAYATSTRGGCHLRAYPISHEILRKPVVTDRFSFDGKARIIKISEDTNAVVDSLTACKFIFFAAGLEEYALALSGVTGRPFSAQDLSLAGERIYYRERMMNQLNGFFREHDTLPERFFTYPGTSGNGIAIPPVNREAFSHALDNYYAVRGLDAAGTTTQAKREELGLAWRS